MEVLKNLVLASWLGVESPMQWILDGADPVNYVVTVLKVIIGLAGLVAAALVVFGAYTLITSSGEPENIAKGQKMVTNAIIGLVIAAIAFLIVNYAIDIAKGSF